MARSMRDIKRQIKSVQNTRQITKAMEMVAASKLRKAQEKAEAARPYSQKLKEVVSSIAACDTGLAASDAGQPSREEDRLYYCYFR